MDVDRFVVGRDAVDQVVRVQQREAYFVNEACQANCRAKFVKV